MTYRSDEELAKQRRDEVVRQYQHDSGEALASVGARYAERVGLRVFAFLSPLLLWVLPAMKCWEREPAYQQNTMAASRVMVALLGSLLIMWLAYASAKRLAALQLKRSLRRYITPTEDAYLDLARLKERPADLLQRRLAELDYAVPLLLLMLVLPALVYVGQYLGGFTPLSPARSQAGLDALSLGFLLCAITTHLCLAFVTSRLLYQSRSGEPVKYQTGRPLMLFWFLLAVVYQAQRYVPWSGGVLDSYHERQDIEALYKANAVLFSCFLLFFEIIVCCIIKRQANLSQEPLEELQ